MMKKILFIVLLAFSLNVKAQITLEHVYDSASTINLLVPDQNQLMIINEELEKTKLKEIIPHFDFRVKMRDDLC